MGALVAPIMLFWLVPRLRPLAALRLWHWPYWQVAGGLLRYHARSELTRS